MKFRVAATAPADMRAFGKIQGSGTTPRVPVKAAEVEMKPHRILLM